MLNLSFRTDRSFKISLALTYFLEAVLVDAGTPLAVTYSGNTQTDWIAASWTDIRASKPSWIDIQAYFASWLYAYNSAPVVNNDLHGFLDNQVNTPLNNKADSSHAHAMSDITGLATELAKYVLGSSSNMLIDVITGNAATDSNGLSKINLADGSNIARWKTTSGQTPKVIAVALDGSGNPMQSVNVVEYSWDSGNKAMNVYASRPKAAALLGGDVSQNAVGYTIVALVLGVKA